MIRRQSIVGTIAAIVLLLGMSLYPVASSAQGSVELLIWD